MYFNIVDEREECVNYQGTVIFTAAGHKAV